MRRAVELHGLEAYPTRRSSVAAYVQDYEQVVEERQRLQDEIMRFTQSYVQMVAYAKNQINQVVVSTRDKLQSVLDEMRQRLVDATDGAVEWRRKGHDTKCYYVEAFRW